MDDGTEEEFGAGDAAIIPPGHDVWVVGNESVVAIDFTGLKDYAKKEWINSNKIALIFLNYFKKNIIYKIA